MQQEDVQLFITIFDLIFHFIGFEGGIWLKINVNIMNFISNMLEFFLPLSHSYAALNPYSCHQKKNFTPK